MIEYSIKLQKSQRELLESVLERRYDNDFGHPDEKNDYGWSFPGATKRIRRLYGIVSFNVINPKYHGWPFHEFRISKNNEVAVERAVKSGYFTKEIEVGDLDVLDFVYNRNQELRERIKHRIPRFTRTEMTKNTSIEKPDLDQRLDRLEGVLGSCLRKYGSYDVRFYILPPAREALAKELLEPSGKKYRSFTVRR